MEEKKKHANETIVLFTYCFFISTRWERVGASVARAACVWLLTLDFQLISLPCSASRFIVVLIMPFLLLLVLCFSFLDKIRWICLLFYSLAKINSSCTCQFALIPNNRSPNDANPKSFDLSLNRLLSSPELTATHLTVIRIFEAFAFFFCIYKPRLGGH